MAVASAIRKPPAPPAMGDTESGSSSCTVSAGAPSQAVVVSAQPAPPGATPATVVRLAFGAPGLKTSRIRLLPESAISTWPPAVTSASVG